MTEPDELSEEEIAAIAQHLSEAIAVAFCESDRSWRPIPFLPLSISIIPDTDVTEEWEVLVGTGAVHVVQGGCVMLDQEAINRFSDACADALSGALKRYSNLRRLFPFSPLFIDTKRYSARRREETLAYVGGTFPRGVASSSVSVRNVTEEGHMLLSFHERISKAIVISEVCGLSDALALIDRYLFRETCPAICLTCDYVETHARTECTGGVPSALPRPWCRHLSSSVSCPATSRT
jgi:hypothetical protein